MGMAESRGQWVSGSVGSVGCANSGESVRQSQGVRMGTAERGDALDFQNHPERYWRGGQNLELDDVTISPP